MKEVFVRGPEKGLHGLCRRNGPGDGSPNWSWAGLCDLEQGPACGLWSFRSRNQKGEHFKSFRDGPPGVKWFLGWMLLAEIVSTWLLANHFCVCKVLVPV